MAKRLAAITILSAIALLGCGGGAATTDQSDAVAQLYSEMLKERKVMDSYEERLALTRGFLDKYPEGEHTAPAVNAVFYYMADKLGDAAGAVEYAEAIRARIGDPEVARDVDKELLRMYAAAAMPAKMSALADRLAKRGALDFDDRWSVIGGAVKAQDWALARSHVARARALATADAVREEDPDGGLSDAEIAEEASHRKGMLLVKDGWARANQGEVDAALADFLSADGLVPRYYFGIPEYDLNVYWARALMMKGDHQAAIDRLALDALVMRNEAALEALEEAYRRLHGSSAGYDAFAAKLHREVAPSFDDFAMPDYAGTVRRFSELRSDVTLVTLWFPT